MVDLRDRYDVIVIGGGPAGSSFVRTFRDRSPDARVLVLDKASFPRDKVCGDALTHTSLPLVGEIFPELRGHIPTESYTRRYTLLYPNGQMFTRDDQELDVIPRRTFDMLLWEAAAHEGATRVEGARVIDITRDGDRVSGVVARVEGRTVEVNADIVVAADGANSMVRRKTRSGAPDPLPIAVRQYISDVPPSGDGLVFLIDPDHHGYFWFFPIVDGSGCSANVGWFGFGTEQVNARHRLEHYLRHDEVARRYVGTGTREGKVVAANLNLAPVHRGRVALRRPLGGDGYVLVGDAAGLIHPYTGEGIAFAIYSGHRAAALIGEHGPLPDGFTLDPSTYESDALTFVGDVYNLPKTTLLFSLPCAVPAALRPAYLRSLPLLDACRKAAKRVRPATERFPGGDTPGPGTGH